MAMLGTIADILGIVSFILTIVLLIYSEALRGEIEAQSEAYRDEQYNVRNQLIALRKNIWEDNLLNRRMISQIRTSLYTFRQKYRRVLKWEDKWRIWQTLRMLDQPPSAVDHNMLCKELDYFIAMFERRIAR